jgi:hypothetical protein
VLDYVPGMACGVWCSPVRTADSHSWSWVQPSRDKCQGLFPREMCTRVVMVPCWPQVCEVYVGYLHDMGPVQCRVQFSLICSLMLFSRKEKKMEEMARVFFLGTHALVAVPVCAGTSPAVMCN